MTNYISFRFRFDLHRPGCFLLPLACATLAATLSTPHDAAAQTTGAAVGNATVNPAGPRTGTNGTNFFNVEGSNNAANATFGVMDFAVSSFNPNSQTANGVSGGALTLSLTESDAAFTAPASLEFYFTTLTSPSIVAGASTLRYNANTGSSATNDPPFGIDAQLGSFGAGTLFDLGSGSFTTTGNTNTGRTDTFTLTLNGALSAFLTQLNTTGSNLRLVIASTNATGAATFFGATNTTNNTTTYKAPTLSFTPTFSLGNNLNWEGASGSSWTPSGTTNWNTTASGPGTTQWVNDGTYTGIFGTGGKTVNIDAGGITTAGLEFDTDGYVINGTGTGNTLTLSSNGHNINVVNATDTATINAPIAGASGLSKVGAGTLILGGANTFSGSVSVTAGTLRIGSDANLGATTNGVTLSNGGTLSTTANVTMAATRTLGGTSGAINAAAGTTLTVNGDTAFSGMLALTGAGTVTLADTSQRGYDSVGSLTYSTASQLNSNGILNVGSAITANHANGTAVLNGNVLFGSSATGTATAPVITVTVANAAATLQVTGAVGGGTFTGTFAAGNATLLKAGPGTLDLLGDNSALTSSSATTATVRQGIAGATAGVDGGTLVVHTTTALGFVSGSTTVGGQYQFNNGTFANASSGVLTFANGLSIGGGGAVASGASFGRVGGADKGSVFTGGVSLFNPTGAAYQHVITVNSPTTFSGQFSVTPGTATNNGLLITGPSTLTLASTAARNTFAENITVASATTLSLMAAGSLDKNPLVSLLTNATLSVTLSPTGGVTDAIGDMTFLDLASGSHVMLNLTGGTETVYGLELNGVVQPAGTYSAATPGGYFTGVGFINNLGAPAAVPEPSSSLLIAAGLIGALALRRKPSGKADRSE